MKTQVRKKTKPAAAPMSWTSALAVALSIALAMASLLALTSALLGGSRAY